MVWVIQRDFLQGKTTQAAVDEALVPVPNPNHETSIEQVCVYVASTCDSHVVRTRTLHGSTMTSSLSEKSIWTLHIALDAKCHASTD